jgi:hypothetical protein
MLYATIPSGGRRWNIFAGETARVDTLIANGATIGRKHKVKV